MAVPVLCVVYFESFEGGGMGETLPLLPVVPLTSVPHRTIRLTRHGEQDVNEDFGVRGGKGDPVIGGSLSWGEGDCCDRLWGGGD